MDLEPGMRVLDLGCGRALSSVFLRREFDVLVWATDLWFSAAENSERIRDAGVEDGVVAIHAEARALPFAAESFDAIVSIDSFFYYGTDDLYLNYLARFLKPGGLLGIAGAALMQEIEGPPRTCARGDEDLCLHSAACGDNWNGRVCRYRGGGRCPKDGVSGRSYRRLPDNTAGQA
jgi:ubiquinone/menaquinone biosynthesis C-methylase UbiE